MSLSSLFYRFDFLDTYRYRNLLDASYYIFLSSKQLQPDKDRLAICDYPAFMRKGFRQVC
jgi:hypothetical protein